VPRVAPDMDGVGEYAIRLTKQLKADHQIETEFLVVRPSARTQPMLEGFVVHKFTQHTVPDFLAAVPADISTVVLQYSNYPYLQGKLDVPIWLAPALRALQKKGVAVVVMFHELPTLKYGILHVRNPIQERLSRDLARLADGVITNNQAFQKMLEGWRQQPVVCQPNFATIGELQGTALPLAERDRILVVFGTSDRNRVYKSNLSILNEICEQLNIHTLYDVGRPLDWDTAALSVKTVKTGVLTNEEISDLMARAFAGVFDYHRFPQNLGKSSVFAAYSAHGLMPICNGRYLRPQDGIVADQHYVDTFTLHACSKDSSPDSWFQTIATNAYQLYSTRSAVARCAEQYAAVIEESAALAKV
ncbi:MAG: hypothetical protein AAGL17_08020, partial [Cyanobacteria bacterium J06576_12]